MSCIDCIDKYLISTLPLFPTPGAPTTAIFTSDNEDFFLLTCLMARMPLLELMLVSQITIILRY